MFDSSRTFQLDASLKPLLSDFYGIAVSEGCCGGFPFGVWGQGSILPLVAPPPPIGGGVPAHIGRDRTHVHSCFHGASSLLAMTLPPHHHRLLQGEGLRIHSHHQQCQVSYSPFPVSSSMAYLIWY